MGWPGTELEVLFSLHLTIHYQYWLHLLSVILQLHLVHVQGKAFDTDH